MVFGICDEYGVLLEFFWKQLLEDEPQNWYTWKLYKIHTKTPILESLFKKVTDLHYATWLKKRNQCSCFCCEYCEIFKSIFF